MAVFFFLNIREGLQAHQFTEEKVFAREDGREGEKKEKRHAKINYLGKDHQY